MRSRRLGRTGLSVSEIGHGLWGMGSWSGSTDEESLRALQLATEHGCTFFDSAWAYGGGRSDRLLGQLIRRNPGAPIVVASKVPPKNLRWPATAADPLDAVFPRDHVFASVERIREALGVDCVDLMQFHVWDDTWAADRRWIDTVADLKARGLIRWFGLSLNRWEPWNGLAALRTGAVDAVQVIYNVFDQAPEDELLPLCRELDVGVIARVPLDEGSLAGTLTKDTRFPAGDWRATYFGPENLTQTLERVERLKALVPPVMSLPELALRFILHNADVATTIVGMRKEGHVRQNTGVSDGSRLPDELMAGLRTHRWDRKRAPWSA